MSAKILQSLNIDTNNSDLYTNFIQMPFKSENTPK